jgi:hypothetical protein
MEGTTIVPNPLHEADNVEQERKLVTWSMLCCGMLGLLCGCLGD